MNVISNLWFMSWVALNLLCRSVMACNTDWIFILLLMLFIVSVMFIKSFILGVGVVLAG